MLTPMQQLEFDLEALRRMQENNLITPEVASWLRKHRLLRSANEELSLSPCPPGFNAFLFPTESK